MIANTINITNGKQLLAEYQYHGIKLAAPIKTLVENILADNLVPEINIRIHEKYLPKTYQKNPNLFALRLDPFTETYEFDYLYISAYRKGDFIIVHRGEEKISQTFFKQAVHSIREYDMWHALKGNIPLTYLTRPKQFTNLLVRHFGCGFATIAKKKSITWSRRKEDLDKYGFIC